MRKIFEEEKYLNTSDTITTVYEQREEARGGRKKRKNSSSKLSHCHHRRAVVRLLLSYQCQVLAIIVVINCYYYSICCYCYCYYYYCCCMLPSNGPKKLVIANFVHWQKGCKIIQLTQLHRAVSRRLFSWLLPPETETLFESEIINSATCQRTPPFRRMLATRHSHSPGFQMAQYVANMRHKNLNRQ